MWRMGVLPAALIVAVLGAPPANADGNSVAIRVNVTGPNKGPGDAVVRFEPFSPYDDGRGSGGGRPAENGDFRADTDLYGTQIKPGVYTATVFGDEAKSYKTITYVGPGQRDAIFVNLGPTSYPPRVGFEYYHHDAVESAERGDKAGYQSNLDNAKKTLQYNEALLDEARKAAGEFIKDNNLQIKDHAGAVKALKLIEKTPENLRDKELQGTLTTLERTLGHIDKLQGLIGEQKKQLADLEAKYGPKFGFLPSACPEGQGGGLLAGTVNSVFGTDLAASNCGETETQGTHGNAEKHQPKEDKRP